MVSEETYRRHDASCITYPLFLFLSSSYHTYNVPSDSPYNNHLTHLINTHPHPPITGGGSGAMHLGGWTKQPDLGGLSNNTFNFMLGIIGVKSVLDVGCGRGISTSYFLDKGADVLCVEGSHEAITQSLLPRDKIVEHDYSLGPWWPSKTYDACWSVEFVEHVPRQFIRNYIPTFQQCALLFVTRSQWGGWSHVEIHQEWWWISRFRVQSFVFDKELTEIIRSNAEADKRASDKTIPKGTDLGTNQLGQHIRSTMMAFVNPKVIPPDCCNYSG